MTTDSNITIYNRRMNEFRNEVLYPTVIKNCTWYYAHIVSGSQMMDNADEYSVRIPIDADFGGKQYIAAHEYAELPDEEAPKYWTISKNDIVVRGEYDTGVIDNQMVLASQTDDIFVVSTYADNTIRGSRKVKHWRVGGS